VAVNHHQGFTEHSEKYSENGNGTLERPDLAPRISPLINLLRQKFECRKATKAASRINEFCTALRGRKQRNLCAVPKQELSV
jgi:hypothetical protein